MVVAASNFHDAIRVTGLHPPEVIEPGKIHRFPGVGKCQRNRAGWCKLFDDGLGGNFGDWSSGFSEVWFAKQYERHTSINWATSKHRISAAKAQAEASCKIRQADAATKAYSIWNAASRNTTNHPYLIRKTIKGIGARLYKRALVLPVRDFTGKLTSLQFINPKGRKRLLSGGRKRGCVIPVVGNTASATRVIICEGWATGCTLSEDEVGVLVLAAIDAGNLEVVAVAARHRWPHAELVIAGDDDRQSPSNPGATKAKAAALAAGALLALPQWPAGAPETLTDFNDLATWLNRRVI